MSEFAYPLGGEQNYSAAQAGAFNGTRTSGVWSGENNLKVTITGAHQLTLSKGLAWFTTEEYWGKVYVNTADINFTLPVADAVLDRICRLVIRWNKTTNTATAQLLLGELSSTPSAPTRSTTDELYDLVLCDYLVAHGEVTASAANLTDQRLNEDLCGLMRDGVTRIPTATLEAKVSALLEELRTAIEQAAGGGIPDGAVTAQKLAADAVKLTFTNTVVEAASFAADETYGDFPYRAAVPLAGVAEAMTPEVVFGAADAMSGTFAPVAESYAGGVYIYAAELPSAAVTIPTILLWR